MYTFEDARLEEVGLLARIMQPNPWDDLTAETGEQQILIDGQPAQISTGFGNQIIMLQPPSSAAKIIGIFVIIYAVFNVIALIGNFLAFSSETINDDLGYTTTDMIIATIQGISIIVTCMIGGIWMLNYQRKGLTLVLIGLLIGFVFQIFLSFGGSTEAAATDSGLSEGVVSGISIGLSAVCSAVCALIVAIPLMVSNNGLDDSKLFG